MEEKTPEQGALFVWSGYLLLYGAAMQNRPHRHVSASVLVGLDRPIRVQLGGSWYTTEAMVVAPDVEQALDSEGGAALIIHIDPDQPLWRHFLSLIGSNGFAELVRAQLQLGRLRAAVDAEQVSAVHDWLETVARALCPAPEALDSRVATVATYLRQTLPERLVLSDLSQQVGLSDSRLTHLFRQQTGVTLRRFLAHLKILQAVFSWRPGVSVTELAAEAGFYDQPHLIRTAREMYDAMPSELVGNRMRIYTDPSVPLRKDVAE